MNEKLTIKISKYFFLLIFLGFFGSNTFFDHAHIYDGNLIIHSHPYKHGDNKTSGHTHTDTGYLLVYYLNTLISNVAISFIVFSFLNNLFREVIKADRSENLTESCKYLFNLRGPPTLLR